MSQTAGRIRWTVHDLEVLPQSEGTRYELIAGELFVTRSPHRKHQQTAGKICSALDSWSSWKFVTLRDRTLCNAKHLLENAMQRLAKANVA